MTTSDPKDLTTEELLMWAQVILEEAVPEDDVVRLARELASRLVAARGVMRVAVMDLGNPHANVNARSTDALDRLRLELKR